MKSQTIYSDKDGVLRVVTESVPEEPMNDPIHSIDAWEVLNEEYREALQHCKDNSVPFEDQRLALSYVRGTELLDRFSTLIATNFKLQPDTFYTVQEFEYEVTHTCKWNGNRDACGNETCWDLNECQKSPENKLARIVAPSGTDTIEHNNCGVPGENLCGIPSKECPNFIAGKCEPIDKDKPDQEQLWRDVDRIFNCKWSYGVIPDDVMNELKEKFTITRKQ